MRYLYAVVENCWFPEYDIFFMAVIVGSHHFCSVKPYEVTYSRAVAEMSRHNSLSVPGRCLLETEDMPFHLYKGHVRCQFVYSVYLAAVNIFIWVMLNKVTVGYDAQFLVQDVLAARTYTLEILYVLVQDAIHVILPLPLSCQTVW